MSLCHPVLVQETTLRQASDYFVKTLDNEDPFGNGEKGVLRFQSEQKQIWETLLVWIISRHLSYVRDIRHLNTTDEPAQVLHLCRCWIAADKYFLPDLQDEAMLHLINIFEKHFITMEMAGKVSHNTSPDSRLRKLVAEEVVHGLDDCSIECEELSALDGAVEAVKSMLQAQEVHQEQDGKLYSKRADEVSELWEEYMVGTSVFRTGLKEVW